MITKDSFPILQYEKIAKTTDAIHSYAKLLGSIRAKMTPEQKEYWHISLRAGTQGFRTTPIPNEDGSTFELSMNLLSHRVEIWTSLGHSRNVTLSGQSLSQFTNEVLSVLHTMGIKPDIELEKFTDNSKLEYDSAVASEIFRSYSLVDIIFKTFKGSITFETSPVQLWPHHMDVAFTCYPPSKDNMDQIAFGYLTGDSGIEEPYFYITVYPELEEYGHINLTDPSCWNTEGWQGVVLKYNDLIQTNNPGGVLMEYLDNTFNQIMK